MGKEDYPLMGFGHWDDLSRVQQPVRDILGQVSGLPKLGDVLLCDRGGHPLASRSGHAAVLRRS